MNVCKRSNRATGLACLAVRFRHPVLQPYGAQQNGSNDVYPKPFEILSRYRIYYRLTCKLLVLSLNAQDLHSIQLKCLLINRDGRQEGKAYILQ